MKRLVFILLFLPMFCIGQGTHSSTNYHCKGGYITTDEAIHLFAFFGDSTVTFSYAAQNTWYQVTNASDSLFRYAETDGFAGITADTIRVDNTGDYFLDAQVTLDGGNGQTVSLRFYNVTQAAGIPTASAMTMANTGNYKTIHVSAYGELTAGDEVILQLRNDAVTPTNSVLKNGIMKILYVHD